MIKIAARQNRKAALLLRRFSTGNNLTRPNAVLDTHRIVRSPQRDTGSADRNRPTGFVIPSTASRTSVQQTSATDRRRRNPHSV